MPRTQITDVLAQSLPSTFTTLCVQRYGGPILLRRVDTTDRSSSTLIYQIQAPSLDPVEISIVVCHVGGNMFEVRGQFAGGPPQTFSYCLSEDRPLLIPKAPRLATEVATYLLDALERRIGRQRLRAELSCHSETGAADSDLSSMEDLPHSREMHPPEGHSASTEQKLQRERRQEQN